MDVCLSKRDIFIGLNMVNGAKNSSFNKKNTSQYVAVSSLQFIYILDSDSLDILGIFLH